MPEAAGDVEVLSVVRDVVAIVKRVTNDPAYRVVLFGSWASGTLRTRSDIDIGVQGPQRIDPRSSWMPDDGHRATALFIVHAMTSRRSSVC